ncbi:hypothetical protein ACQ10M_13045, partial [Enterococcus faecium]|uniref:hypothetical protein n=1 Tax=Enterococcus faecium TaxID=1352 RepID=UPI00403F12A7
ETKKVIIRLPLGSFRRFQLKSMNYSGEIADNKKTSGALISFSVENADEVKKFAQIAKENGGTFHEVDMGMPEEEMFSLEVQDLDGNTLEPVWMKM